MVFDVLIVGAGPAGLSAALLLGRSRRKVARPRGGEDRRLPEHQRPGLFVAGDAARDLKFISAAAAEGTRAGFAINKSLWKEELSLAYEPGRR